MANWRHVRRLKKSYPGKRRYEGWNLWRKKHPEIRPDLLKIDLNGAYLSEIDLNGANLSDADLSGANLSGANLSGADFRRANLSGADLSGADLSGADLSGADLSGANLSGARLNGTDLTMVQALKTNFEKAILTGACLKDWNINRDTDFGKVVCDYVYLEENQQERRPRKGLFQSGEFAALFQKALDTVDLIFKDGIDWQSFFQSFQDLRSQYTKQ